ncbi:hypothetical protein, partial [uncultured Rikenella sp.]|uniref:hypothetical protein n=1 Tax=uncultured Rikenella sp. TaxID=368003 RepID=UPI00272A674C
DFTRFAVSKIEMKSQRATANAAERKRSRSEADTGRRIGAVLWAKSDKAGLDRLGGERGTAPATRRVARAEASGRGGTHSVFCCQPLP